MLKYPIMGREQGAKGEVSQAQATQKDVIDKQRRKNRPGLFTYAITEAAIAIGYGKLERITRNSGLEFHPDFVDVFAEAVADGDLLIVASNHDSLYNVHSMALVTHELTLAKQNMLDDPDSIPRFGLPAASSLITGDQGYFDRRAAEVTEKTINNRHLHTIPYTRLKDEKQYETPEMSSDTAKNLLKAFRAKEGFAIFPEGNMGDGTGMRKFSEQDAIPGLINLAIRRKQGVTLIPVGINGGDKVLPPHKAPTKEAWLAGFGLRNPRMVNIKVGLPIRGTPEILAMALSNNPEDVEAFNNYLGVKISELVIEGRRGFYGDQIILSPGKAVKVGR